MSNHLDKTIDTLITKFSPCEHGDQSEHNRKIKAQLLDLLLERLPEKKNVNDGSGFSKYSEGVDVGYNQALDECAQAIKEVFK